MVSASRNPELKTAWRFLEARGVVRSANVLVSWNIEVVLVQSEGLQHDAHVVSRMPR
jgi:hypothetical protein